MQILFLSERNFEIAARTLCLRVRGATPSFTAAVKIPLPRQHFSSRILFDRKLFLLTMDQTKSIKLQKKRLESAEKRRARLDKNNEKARAKSRTETEQKKDSICARHPF